MSNRERNEPPNKEKAGWDVRGVESLFDADIDLQPEATLELSDGRRSLRFGYFIERASTQSHDSAAEQKELDQTAKRVSRTVRLAAGQFRRSPDQ